MEFKNIYYIIIGVLFGLLLSSLFPSLMSDSPAGSCKHMRGQHEMPDCAMMHDGAMNMHSMMNGMMMGLDGKTGDEFDKAFLSEMIVHHRGAVTMAEAVLKNSQRADLLKLAQEIITAQTKEIQMMEGWQKMWFK